MSKSTYRLPVDRRLGHSYERPIAHEGKDQLDAYIPAYLQQNILRYGFGAKGTL